MSKTQYWRKGRGSQSPTALCPSAAVIRRRVGIGWFSGVIAVAVWAISSTGTFAVAANASPNYSSVILADSPLAYWRFGESPGTTTAADSSGNGFTGSYAPCVTLGVPGAIRADTNTAGLFGIKPGCWMEATTSSTYTGSYSVEAWVRPGSTSKAFQTIIGSRAPDTDLGSGESSFDLKLTGTSNSVGQAICTNIGDGYSFLESGDGCVPFIFKADHWYYVAMTVDQSNSVAVIYVDGSFLGALGIQTSLAYGPLLLADPNHPFGVGGSLRYDLSGGSDIENFDGRIDEAAVYTKVLTPAQVLAHYKAGTGA